MEKYLTLLSLSWSNGFVYRTSLFLWRVRQFLSTLMALTIWTVLYTNQQSAFGYDQSSMITYIFLIGVLQSLVLATVMHGLASRIYSGELSLELVKPVNLYGYLFTQEIADKLKNFVFIIIETLLLFWIFKPEIIWPDVSIWPVFVIMVLGAIIMHFLIQLIFGALGFWSPETWGPRFLFYMFMDFTAGKLFPLDILPPTFQKIAFLTPFPYLSFVQIQIFLQKLSSTEILQHLIIMTGWILFLGIIVRNLWKVGLREYAAAGQ